MARNTAVQAKPSRFVAINKAVIAKQRLQQRCGLFIDSRIHVLTEQLGLRPGYRGLKQTIVPDLRLRTHRRRDHGDC